MASSIAIYHNNFICKHLNGFKYCYVTLTIQFNIICLQTIKGSKQFYLTHGGDSLSITTSGQSRPGSNDNEEVLHIL